MKGEILQSDPYNGLCISIIETAECLYMLQDYCQTNALARIKHALGMNRHKGMGTS